MKALIQKDLRENLKVALIGLLIFSLLLLQAYQSCISTLANFMRGNWSGQAGNLQPLLASNLVMEAAFACALFGAALGWLQTRNEAHRDLWAFLIHRPITRTEIFWGKSIAGLCLYAFGTGVPLFILITVVRLPGHVAAPFEWAMTTPLVSVFLTGAAYYFAGMLTGLRQARWFVSRSFGLALAIAATIAAFGPPEFWMSGVSILIVIAILATAAWGAYQSSGGYQGQPVAGRLALTLAMAAGCSVVLFVGAGLFFTLVVNPLSHPSSEYSYYTITRDGTIYKVTMRDNETEDIVDLDGHPLLDPKTSQRMERKEFQKLAAYGGSVHTTLNHPQVDQNVMQDPGQFFSVVNITDKTLWYLDRHGRLIGYDGQTRKFIGNLDAHGLEDAVAFEPFLQRGGNYYYSYNDLPRKLLATARSVYRVDFKDRTVTPVFTLKGDDEIGAYMEDPVSYDDFQLKKLLLTTRKTVQMLDAKGQPLFTVPYQPGCAEYPQVQLSFLIKATNTFVLWFYPDAELNEKAHWTMPLHVQWVGAESAVTKNIELPVLRQQTDESWSTKLMIALLPPPAHVKFSREIFSAWNLFSDALAVICAAIAWRLVRRYNFSTKAGIGWTLFVFLLGIPGLLTLLVVQEWPVRETCPNCQKLRTVDRAACEHCAAAFSPPPKNGTEIFAALSKI